MVLCFSEIQIGLLIVLLIISCVVFGITATVVSRGRNGPMWGIESFFLGFFLGPCGIVIAAFLGTGKFCCYCREPIKFEARKCPHCHSELR
jgi:hypothetical protein